MEFELPPLKERVIEGKSIDIILYSLEQSEKEQIGYSISRSGEPLYGFEEGDWQEGWYVIGRESGCGDPIIIDLNDHELPIYTAMHGQGTWNEIILADSYEEFLAILNNERKPVYENAVWQFFYNKI